MIRFTIPYPPTKDGKRNFCRRFGLNAYYSGKDYHVRKRDADELHLLAWAAMRKAGIRKEIVDYPVSMIFYFNDNLDCSNHAAIVKMVEDAMKGWIIKDDNRKYVKSITTKFHNEDCIKVIIMEDCKSE